MHNWLDVVEIRMRAMTREAQGIMKIQKTLVALMEGVGKLSRQLEQTNKINEGTMVQAKLDKGKAPTERENLSCIWN